MRVGGWLWLALPAVLAAALVLIATRDGIGVSIDSVIYLSVAREISAGHGAVVPWGAPEPTPLGTQLGPLLPASLAVVSRLGPDPVVAARWLNALLYGATVLLIGVYMRRATGSVWPAAWVATLIATSRLLLNIHAMAWSEPMFLLFTMAALFLLASYISTSRVLVLAAACAATALALLTRWAGAALAVAAFSALMLGRTKLRYRAIAAAGIAVLLCMPMYSGGPAWIKYICQCFQIGPELSQPDSRERAYLVNNVRSGLGVIVDWIRPWPLPNFSISVPALAALAGCVAAILLGLAIRARLSQSFGKRGDSAALRANLCWVLGLFLAVYPAFLVGIMVFFGKNKLAFDSRILSPLLIPGLLLAFLGAYSLWLRLERRYGITMPAVICCCAVLVIRIPRAVDRSIALAHTSGAGAEGYQDAKWRASPTIDVVRSLPVDVPLYSNAPDALYMLAQRRACWLPSRWSLASREEDREAGYASLSDLRAAIRKGAMIVYFDRLAWRNSMPSLEELARHIAIEPVVRTADGVVCTIEDRAAAITPE